MTGVHACVVESVDSDPTGNGFPATIAHVLFLPFPFVCMCVCVCVQEMAGETAPFPLTTKHIVDVKHELCPFAKWKELGLNLGLSPESLEVIENDSSRTDDRLHAVLLQWLQRNYDLDKSGLPSWRQLAEAVKPINHTLASTIKDRHPS